MRVAEKRYFNNVIERNKKNLSKVWKVINGIINKHKNAKVTNRFKYHDSILTNPKDIANHFNFYFSNVGSNLAKNIPVSGTRPESYLTGQYINSFFFSPVTEDDVRILISSLRDSSPGSDDIKPQVIKHVSNEILISLTHIINLSLQVGIFPDDMKTAKVLPLFKKGDPEIFSNYRPISLLSCFSKVLEKVVYNQLLTYLDDLDILYQLQFGFRKKYNTELAISFLSNKISEAFERQEHSIGVFLDLSKAFDTVNHHILMTKLMSYGIRGLPLQWFSSYLSNRYQYVYLQNEKSNLLNVTHGVPQGSILGPLLFLIYINDLFVVCPECLCLLFADDTSLLFSDKNFQDLVLNVNQTLERVSTWFQVNKLSVNVEKTNYMIFHSRNKKYNNNDIKIEINNSNILQVTKVKFLGIWMDDHLTWKFHLIYISNKISKVIGILKKVKQSVGTYILRNLYFALIYPYFTYGNITWAANYKSNLDCLIKLQKKIIRIMSNSGFNDHTEPIFRELYIMKFEFLNKFLTGLFMFKIMNNLLPAFCQDLFIVNQDIHHYDTRQKHNLHIFRYRVNTSLFSIKINGPRIWNELPISLRTLSSLYAFKSKLKKLYMEHI